ncbi:TonB-like [Rhodopseudomonas palustris BisB5]|uniref:TonB-like n=1 Tax=Rhodopseudomonas palustris (strain BisB5) TaxID=316057 RepID=Q137Z8_RHOPS|nr:TonB-like [Rhodopseudomonas palustris BisB5]
MNAWSLHGRFERGAASRWLLSAAVIVGVHAAAIAAALAYYAQTSPPGETMPTIMIDMAPATAAPEPSRFDLPSGPEMQEAEAPDAEPEPRQRAAAPPEIAATPLQPAPQAPMPPESKSNSDADKAEPTQAKAEPVRAKPIKRQVAKLHPSDTPPAPRSSAPQRAERRAMTTTAALAGADAAAALPTYRQRVAAHLQRFKRYPANARAAGEQGTATLAFTVGRSGQLLGARLVRSSGDARLDAETLSMVRRSELLPPFPPELPQATLSFSVPVNYFVRQ